MGAIYLAVAQGTEAAVGFGEECVDAGMGGTDKGGGKVVFLGEIPRVADRIKIIQVCFPEEGGTDGTGNAPIHRFKELAGLEELKKREKLSWGNVRGGAVVRREQLCRGSDSQPYAAS